MNSNQTIFSSEMYMYDIPVTRTQVYNVCFEQPMKVVSNGIWSNDSGHHIQFIPSQSAFTIFELQILVIFVVTQGFHFILKRIGIPYFVSQVMAGFLLGPSIPTGPLEKYKEMLFPFGSPDILNTISALGYSFFLFITSVQMDLSLITKTGKKAWVLGLGSYFVPIGAGYLINSIDTPALRLLVPADVRNNIPVVFISHSGCSFAVITVLLNDLGILNSELGRLALSSAFVSDLTGGIWAGVGTAIVSEDNGLGHRIINVAVFLGFIIFIPLIGRPAMTWVVKRTPEGRPVKKIYIYIIIMVVTVLGYNARFFRQPFFSAAVIFGLAVPEGPPLGSELVNQLELFSTWFLTSIFITCSVMKVDFAECDSLTVVLVISGYIIMVHFIKCVLCMGICRYCKMPSTDGFCLALILSCKGAADICSYVLVYDSMAQSKKVIVIMIVYVMFLGTASRLGVKALYDPSRKYAGYQKRNIMNLKENNELRIVACIHKPCHMNHIRNVLQLCSPGPENRLVTEILHLMELVGRSTPIFIAHKLQQGADSSSYNYSGELIMTFDLFERDHAGFATANTYTAISPMTLMHEDVCNLSLDKNTALIILPFHVKWGGDGSIESEDNNLKALNLKVLERAPCSIGILINRGPSCFTSTCYNVAMVFLGGPDDREALCLAKRFAKNVGNMLFVYRLLARDRDASDWEHMIDDELLRDISGSYVRLENVSYEETIIDDGLETMFFVKELANNFDFIIVGRRNCMRSSQTSGLETWTEHSELGVIGDLLASPDTKTKASILVVQQQSTAGS
ncbi:hypothetical protein Fmac_026697 [Flemingia macrophylla]|uniref:Cation/H+ exchanger domain-containing protein n=1 Tax=Flemingia macrophylla TaxID=520843 RepID=A0ABD1LFK1_9FABA